MQKILFVTGALLLGLAVGLGALGAHGLEQVLPNWFEDHERRLAAWDTAVFWQSVHALGLMAIALSPLPGQGRGRIAAWLFLAGIVLFSWCLYAWVVSGTKFLVALVPAGGILMICGWLALAVSAFNAAWPESDS